MLQGRDVLGLAQTGTGKTGSFTLPMLTRLEKGRTRARMPRSLIIEPTRELAAQVYESFVEFGVNHRLTVALLIGGVSFGEQNQKLDRGADVLIATPGRLLDHFERGKLMMNGVEILVIDEADRMLDMGFIPDIERICKLLPMTRQTLLFSATMPAEIQHIADMFLHNPERVEVSRRSAAAGTVRQHWVKVPFDPTSKRAAFRKLIDTLDVKNAIVFCNRKRDVETLERSFQRHGLNGKALHGDMNQYARLETLNKFRDGEVKFLLASDVAARGLDIPKVSHVFNFDIPDQAEDYVHRIGRTGRAGLEGHAFGLVTPKDLRRIKDIQQLAGAPVEWFGTDQETPEAGAGDDAAGDAPAKRRPSRGRQRKPAAGQERAARSDTHKPAAKQTDETPPKPKPAAKQTDETPPKPKPARKSESPGKSAETGMGDHVPAFLLRSAKT